jgi:hypothetical protein
LDVFRLKVLFSEMDRAKKEIEAFFVNTIAPWPVPVRQSLQNLRGAFTAAFTSEK